MSNFKITSGKERDARIQPILDAMGEPEIDVQPIKVDGKEGFRITGKSPDGLVEAYWDNSTVTDHIIFRIKQRIALRWEGERKKQEGNNG